jgi:hypothetical protein
LQDQWLEQYEAEDFPTDVYKVWTDETEIAGRKLSLEKFYKQLHAYVRRKLHNFYDKQVIISHPFQQVSTFLYIFGLKKTHKNFFLLL